jgi:hypothetical protein
MNSSLYECQPGDKIMSPRGETLYQHPRIIMGGIKGFAFMVNGSAVGVMVFRQGEPTVLRYCDPAGVVHVETMKPGSLEAQATEAMLRMAELIRTYLGERHPHAVAAQTAAAAPA